MKAAVLALEDGTILEGGAFGAEADAVFELVFNTSMTGYQEILTDSSYRGQGVLFTASHIGNVGINIEDFEAERPQVSALVLRALSPSVSNWRATQSLADWLSGSGIPGISGVDTRFLTRRLRDGGTQRAALSTRGTPAPDLLQAARDWPGLDGRDMVREVTCAENYAWLGDHASAWVPLQVDDETPPVKIVAYDFGIKRNILRQLSSYNAFVTVVPADTPAVEVLALHPHGIFLSNGPGDPAGLPYAVDACRTLVDSGIPILGICLGHQLLGLALGGKTARLKFGHHGANHPVQDLRDSRVSITAQNHNYIVQIDSLDQRQVEITHVSLNDSSLEGMHLRDRPVLSVQFHPEAAPGPHDAFGVFAEFFSAVRAYARKAN